MQVRSMPIMYVRDYKAVEEAMTEERRGIQGTLAHGAERDQRDRRQEPTLANGPDTAGAWFRRGIYLAAGFFVLPFIVAFIVLLLMILLSLISHI